MKIKLLIILICVVWFTGCSPRIKTFTWLEGTWEMQRPKEGSQLEIWDDSGFRALSGQGLKVLAGDTALLEKIQLYYKDRHFWYVPTVPDQNNQRAIPFKMVSAENNQYTFENPVHDFPQRIVYNFKPFTPENSESIAGDTLDVAVTSLEGEGIHFRFFRK